MKDAKSQKASLEKIWIFQEKLWNSNHQPQARR